jgi:hypothetical protein
MRATTAWVLGFLVLGTASSAAANSTGSPVCDATAAQMSTTHAGVSATEAPLGIALNVPATAAPSQPITVTLTGAGLYHGLLLIAEQQGQRVGSFTPPNGFGTMSCTGSPAGTLTHTSTAVKSLPATFTWTAPASFSTVTFRGVVMRDSNPPQFQMLAPVTANVAQSIAVGPPLLIGALGLALAAVGAGSLRRRRA